MSGITVFGIMLASPVILASGWLGWQLLRQNGRLLLRIEELERRLDEMEFGESDEIDARPLPRGEGGPTSQSEFRDTNSETDQSFVPSAAPTRFSGRSVARSKIKRDGLKAGTPAPGFRLPRLDGHGELALKELSGRPVLLVFSDPHCGPCNALAPELEKFHREQPGRQVGRVCPSAPQGDGMFQNGAHGVTRPNSTSSSIALVMISRGEPEDNRAKVKEHGLTFPVVLQQQWEISRRYAMFATPMAYVIDERGLIAHDVAVGTDAIVALMNSEPESWRLSAQHG